MDHDTVSAVECSPRGKTGSGGRPWVRLEPKPAKVGDHYAYWTQPPPELSSRCRYWVRQIARGWRPNRSWSAWSDDSAAQLYGVYIWELRHVIRPALDGAA